MMLDIKLAIRTFFTNLVVSLAIVLTIYGANELSTNSAIQWVICIIAMAIYAVVVWVFFTTTGKKDYTADVIRQKRIDSGAASADPIRFNPKKGFVAAAISHIPVTAAAVLCLFPGEISGVMDNLLRVWFSQYNMIYKVLSSGLPWLYFGFIAVFIIFAGFGYINGRTQYENMKLMIQRNSQRAGGKNRPQQK